MKAHRNPNDPYRIVVWGPGSVGQACIREILQRPEFKLVGVLAYSETKAGKDIGELMGRAPLGVKVTTDKEAIYAMDADVVIWCGHAAYNPAAMIDDEVLALLASGKNVVTPAFYHYPPKQGRAYVEKIEAACRKGQSSVFGTGVNPGFWFERMVPTLTGLCTSVESIFLDEYADCSCSSVDLLRGIGFGLSDEEARTQGEFLHSLWSKMYYVEAMEMTAQSTWGRSVERWEVDAQYLPADREIVLDKAKGDPITMTIPKGLISGVRNTITGYIDDQLRVKTRVNWFLRPENAPFPCKSGDLWKIEIEGRPVSLRCEFDAFASLKGDLEFQSGNLMSSSWYATVVTLIQGIPIVVGHKPGFVVPSVFANCVSDFRELETRESIVTTHRYPK